MNKTFISLLAVMVFCGSLLSGRMNTEKMVQKLEGTITISGAWALYPMVVKWAEEFQKVYPAVRIDISAGGAGKGIADALAGVVDLGMVSRDIHPEEIKKGAWFLAVTKDAVVPTINKDNPFLKELLAKGVKKETLIGIWINESVKTWEEVLGRQGDTILQVYTRSDSCGAAEVWAQFFSGKQEDLMGIGVYGDPGVSEAVKKDPQGIGYNNINYAYDAGTKREILGIRVLPIDLNGDGKLGTEENFYSTRDQLALAIAEGKYPSPPARELFLVAKGSPQSTLVRYFLRWILAEGQTFVPETGYINLTPKRLQEELKKIER